MNAIDAQVVRLTAARTYLNHVLGCPREHALEQCPQFRATVGPRSPVDRPEPTIRASLLPAFVYVLIGQPPGKT